MRSQTNSWRACIRDFIPPVLRRLKRVVFGWRWFRGRFSTWEEARAQTGGYDAPAILEKVLQATLKVRAGEAAYERDSVLFAEPACDAHLLACLLQVAAENGGRLRVLDFGGSLGTTYWQHRRELSCLTELRWDIVEQPHFVTTGRRHLQDQVLRFFSTIAEAQHDGTHDVLLASGVVHCLPSPHDFLEEWITARFPVMILHNVPLHDDEPDHLRIEQVPPEVYSANYPVWFFNRSRFLAHFDGRYEIERTFASPAIWWVGWRDYYSTGLMLRRVTAPSP